MSTRDGLEFHPRDHTYTKGGVLVPGVTTVLNILDTYAGIPAGVLEYAARLGTAVHKATELDDLGTLDEATVADEIWPYLLGYRAFRRDFELEQIDPSRVERRVFHAKAWYAGTLDRLLVIDGEISVVDIKSTRQLMPSTGPQTAAYLHAWNYRRQVDLKAKRRYALQVTDDGDYNLKEYKDAGDFGLFMACLALHNWKANNQ